MRRTFIVLGKLLGLVVLYWLLAALVQLVLAIQIWLSWEEAPGGRALWVLISGAYVPLSLILALLPMFKTERVADWLRLKKDEDLGKAPSTHAILVSGSALVGLLALAFAIPSVVRSLVELIQDTHSWGPSYHLPELIGSALQLTLGLLLTLKAKEVAGFIESKAGNLEQRTRPEGKELPRPPGE